MWGEILMKEKSVCFECGEVLTEGNSYTLDGNTMDNVTAKENW